MNLKTQSGEYSLVKTNGKWHVFRGSEELRSELFDNDSVCKHLEKSYGCLSRSLAIRSVDEVGDVARMCPNCERKLSVVL